MCEFNYCIGDTHFKHSNILLYEPSRVTASRIAGYEDFDEFLIDRWNETVKPEDKVIHLGDVGFGNGFKDAAKLNGKITLIIGNHDRSTHIKYYKKLGWNVIEKPTFYDIEKKELLLHKLKTKFKDRMDNKLLSLLVCKINDKMVMFSHLPVFDDNPYDKKYKNITEILEYIFTETKCDINIHGHTHSKNAKKLFCINTSIEANNFKLLNLKNTL